MIGIRRYVLALALASCYGPVSVRRDRTTLTPESGAVMAAALAPAPTGPTQQQVFEQHYQAALAFYEQTKFPEAIAEFEAAYTVDPQPLLIFNIGQAYRKAGRLDEALTRYREYLDKDPAAERDRVNDIIRDVERSLAKRKPAARAASKP